ncbi:MAG: cysteine desulfurase-like protein [Candidatus Eremiobacteraeota bacterium]|nr:cysteine desulfurase-like protein [Candidatus Eremiobacteraeota bacterium]MBC5821040.1 cysteine desulfurase-like protein [Candidatus Eremiobacteraeota bacterium]
MANPQGVTTLHQTVAQRVRPAFPALRRTIAGRPVAYFDGPGGTQVSEPVVAAMNDYLLHHNANDGWAYATSAETDEALAKARALAASFVGAGSPDEILFGNNMTTLTFALSRAFGRTLRRGDEIVVTDLDHHANIDPWLALERDYGAVVKRVPLLERQPQLDIAAFERLLGPRTRLVAIGLSSNAFGTVNPVAMMAESARRAGALVFVDAVHSAAHTALDVRALGADMLAFSTYKVYGPHVGVAYVRDELLDRFDFPRVAPQTPIGPKRAESGTLNHEGVVGTGAAVEFLANASAPSAAGSLDARLAASLGALAHDEELLFRALTAGLRALPNVTLYEPPAGKPCHPTLAFSVHGRSARDVAAHLSTTHGIFVSHGDFYAATAVRTVAPDAADGVVRAGISIYTTSDEVGRLVDAVGTLAS